MWRFPLIAIAFTLAGCAASRQEVVAKLGQEFVGQNVDKLVLRFGPPSGSFRLNGGGGSYVWQLAAVTSVAVNQYGYGSGSTSYCKVSVVTNPGGTVTELDTEDRDGVLGSMCARRLGMERASS
jgi:hypothetical protein